MMYSHNYFKLSNEMYMLYAFVILLVLWLLLRGLRNWYWKHDQMISLMQEISEKLTRLDSSINKQNNNISKMEISKSDSAHINEVEVDDKAKVKKPKESIWTKKLF